VVGTTSAQALDPLGDQRGLQLKGGPVGVRGSLEDP
jgi:hypothetical protein